MKNMWRLTGGFVLLALSITSCKKDPLKSLSNDDSRIYITNYDTTANFSSYTSFSISDSVDVIQDNQLYDRERTSYDSAVITAFTQGMVQRGYTQVGREGNPDLAVNVSRVYSTSSGYFSYDDYWDYYGSYYDPYYWGYGGYGYYSPYAVGYYSITQGGLEVDLLDLKNATSNGNKIVVVWTGLARGEQTFHTGNAVGEVDALLGQSTYLKK